MLTALTYRRARGLVLAVGLILLGLVAITMLLRGIDPVEVTATLMFAPLLAGFLFYGLRAGLALGLVASTIYLAMRWPAIRIVGFPAVAGLVFSRVVGFLAFGLAGGWAADRVKRGLDKLDLYDEIDDESGLGNARSFLSAVDLETSRAQRYEKFFAVVIARFSDAPWASERPRRRRAAMRAFGSHLSAGARATDHLAHGRTGTKHVVAAVLPETSAGGVRTFADNLSDAIKSVTGSVPEIATAVYPGDEDRLADMVEAFRRIDDASRPGA